MPLFVSLVCPGSFKRYAQALALTQRARLLIREAISNQAVIDSLVLPSFSFAPSLPEIEELERVVTSTEATLKSSWFVFNGGAFTSATQTLGTSDHIKKPLFFDIALNYADVDVDALRGKAGLVVQHNNPVLSSIQKVKEVVVQEPVPAENAPAAGSRFGSLLGSWWGRR